MNSNQPAFPKKPYRKPALRVYGALQDLTKTVGMGATNDGLGGGNMNKTS